MRKLAKLAASFHRRPSDTQRLGTGLSWFGSFALLLGISVPLGAIGALVIWQSVRAQRDSVVSVPITREGWRVLYRPATETEMCTLIPPQSPKCLASPTQPTLWQSPFSRSAPDHSDRVAGQRGSDFWLGAQIAPEDMKRAFKLAANHLVLGYLNATFDVWVDGARVVTGNYQTTHYPLVITLRPERMLEARPLSVAIRFTHDAGGEFPDGLAYFRREGLATFSEVQQYLRAESVEEHLRPTLFFGVYLILGLLFAGLWIGNPRKPECLFLALYALCQSFLQAFNTDFVNAYMTNWTWQRLNLIALVVEGAIAVFLGLAFARFRRQFFQWGVSGLLVISAVLYLYIDEAKASMLNSYLAAKFIPASYLLGSLACILQASWLMERRKGRGIFPVRTRRLLLFGIGLSGIGIGYALNQVAPSVESDMLWWPRYTNFCLVFYLAAMVLKDYREQERILERSPVSPYHRRAVLPERLAGALVQIDLKRSEVLIREGMARGNAGEFINMALSHLWSAVAEAKGTVLQTEGDNLLAFFEEDTSSPALARAVETLNVIRQKLAGYSDQLREQGVVQPEYGNVRFRGALCFGEVKPLWHDINGQKFPGWVAAGSDNVFLELARLLELEPKVDPERARDVVVTPRALTPSLRGGLIPEGAWVLEDGSFSVKHGMIVNVSAFTLESTNLAKARVA